MYLFRLGGGSPSCLVIFPPSKLALLPSFLRKTLLSGELAKCLLVKVTGATPQLTTTHEPDKTLFSLMKRQDRANDLLFILFSPSLAPRGNRATTRLLILLSSWTPGPDFWVIKWCARCPPPLTDPTRPPSFCLALYSSRINVPGVGRASVSLIVVILI